MWSIYTMKCYSTIRKNEIMPFAATQMDLESVILSELSQREKEKYCMTSLLCGLRKEMILMNLLTKEKETHRLREQNYGCRWVGTVGEFGVDMCTLLYLKWINNKDLLQSTWNSAQCYVAAWIGEEFGGERIHVYVPRPFAIHLNLSQRCYLPISQHKIGLPWWLRW